MCKCDCLNCKKPDCDYDGLTPAEKKHLRYVEAYKDPEYRAKCNAQAKAWRLANLERCKAYGKAYRLKHQDEIRLKNMEYREKNKEKILEQQRERRQYV